jgi:hypothetical protein
MQEDPMEYSKQFEALEERVRAAKSALLTAASESRDQLGQRIDRAQAAVDQATTGAQEKASQAADSARSKWGQMRADAAAKAEDVKAKMDKRNRQLDAKVAASDADWAESEAAEALALAVWSIDNAQLASLDAIDARVRADELAKVASS